MFHSTTSIAAVLSAFCFIVVLLLFVAGEAQARRLDRLVDRDWAARQRRTNQPRGGSQ